MAEINIDDRNFYKGQMDSDSAPELVENGRYRYALNCRPYNTETGSVGVITNSEGNEEIPYTFEDIDDGFLRVIGNHLDKKRRRIYWFVWGNSGTNDEKAYIIYYSYDTQEITTVFSYDDVLGFSKTSVLQSVNIIYDDVIGDTIKWVASGEPREINVTAGVNRFNTYTTNTDDFSVGDIVFADANEFNNDATLYVPCECLTATDDYPTYNYTTGELNEPEWKTLPVSDCYPPFILESMFYQKTRAPRFSPLSTYNYDDGTGDAVGSATFLRRRSFQFAYKYVMFDGQETEWSPISEAVFSQETTSAIFSIGASTVDIDYPTPLSISTRIPISTYRTNGSGREDFVEFPNAMIARVRVAIREVPLSSTPTDWLLLEDIDFEDFYNYNVSELPINTGFPVAGTAGTYYYDWDSKSYNITPSGQSSTIVTITVDYDGSQTLTPLDIADTSALYYQVPKDPNTQTISSNRSFFGGGSDGINVSRDVVKSIEDNIRVSPIPYSVDLDIENQETTINTWFSAATSATIINSDKTANIQFSLGQSLDVADYENTFYYDFYIDIDLEYQLIGGFPPTLTRNFSRQVSGSSYGIPSEFSTFQEFLEDAVNTAYSDVLTDNDPNGNITLDSVSVDNTTGLLTLEFDINPLLPNAEITSIDLSIINPDSSFFYTLRGYLPERTFKDHSTQQYGFVFGDENGRLSPTIEGDWGRGEIPHFYNESLEPQKFLMDVYGLADIDVPEDAKTLHIVRKRSETYSDFIQFALSRGNCPNQSWNSVSGRQYEIGFLDLDLDTPIPIPSDNKYLYISLNAVNGGMGAAYETLFNASILDFLPQQGDVIRFLYHQDSDGVVIDTYESSFNILGYNEEFNTIVIDWDDILSEEPYLAEFLEDGDATRRVICDITKKQTASEQEFYWEVAAQLSCTNGSVDIEGTKNNILLFGDVYMKVRGYCIDFGVSSGAPNPTYQNFVLQDKNYNDFVKSANVGEGRPNAVVKGLRRGDNVYSEVNRDNLIRYSEQSIQNTDIRKFSTVYNANIEEVDNINGRIELLHGNSDKLEIFQEDKLSYAYIDRAVTTELGGEERVIATQTSVLSDVIYNPSNYGISTDSTSFAKSGYREYFTDSKRGNVYRKSLDGITAISEIGMSGYFKDVFRKIRNSFTTPIIRGIVDERTDEYILSLTYSVSTSVQIYDATPILFTFDIPEDSSYFQLFANNDTVLIDTEPSDKYAPTEFTTIGNQDGQSVTVRQKADLYPPETGDTVEVSIPVTETLIFSERTGGWTTFMSYDAEWLSSGIQSYHTFVNGQMWIHDIGNTDYNTFHDRTFVSELDVVGNKNPMLTKFWKTIGVKSKFQNVSIEEGDIQTSNEQESYIPAEVFENREDTQWAYFLGEGTGDEVLEGDKLRGRWISTKITFNKPEVNSDNLKVFSIVNTSGDSGFTV